jgi:hypothetical protein
LPFRLPSHEAYSSPRKATQAWAVIGSLYAAQLSDKALKWLTDNAVIIAEQRSSAVEILGCISVWLEG